MSSHINLLTGTASSAYGPDSRAVLSDTDALDLATRVSRSFQDDDRKRRAWDRFRIYNENHRDLIAERVIGTYESNDIIKRIQRHITVAHNAARDVTRKVCIVYKDGVERTVAGVDEGKSQAFRDAVAESQIDILDLEWLRLAFLVGPIIVIPFINGRGDFRFDTLLPHFTDIVRDPDDPMGTPVAAAWTVRPDSDIAGDRKADTVVLDGFSWRYFQSKGATLELISEDVHGLGEFPGEELRLDVPLDADWWGSFQNERVVATTIEIGVVAATMSFVRKSQNKKLLTMIGDLGDAVAKGQRLDPEAPIEAQTPEAGTVDIESIDFDTPVTQFRDHIRFLKEDLIESFGIPDSAVSFDTVGSGQGGGERMSVTHHGLTEIRNEQVPFCRRFEGDLWPKAVAMLRAKRHPLAASLPTVDEVRDGFLLNIPQLSRVFADPQQERDHKDWKIKKGMTSQLRLLGEEHPTLTDEQLIVLQSEILEEQKEFNDEVTKRNLNMSGDGTIQTAAEAFGATGPMIRDGNGPPETGDNEDQ